MTPAERRASSTLASIYGLRMLGLFFILPVFAIYAEHLPHGQDKFLVGLALGIYGLTQAVLQIPFGVASDHFGRKPVMVFGLLIFAIGSFVAGATDNLYLIIIGRAIQGAGAISAAISAMIADSTRDQHRTKAMAMVGMTIGFSFILSLVLGPLYEGLGVVYPQNGLEEAIGVPMTVICDVRKAGRDGLDAETLAFTDRMADAAGWEAYQWHNYNGIKFGATRGLVSHLALADVLRMAGKAAASAPQVAFQAVNGVTDLVWGLADEGAANVRVRNSGDLPSLPRSLPPRLPGPAQLLNAAIAPPLSLWPVSWYVGNIGVSLAAMLVCALAALRRFGPRALLLCLPILLYNLGTMFVLCGQDARFFSYSPLLCTLLLPVLLARAPAADTLQDGKVAAP